MSSEAIKNFDVYSVGVFMRTFPVKSVKAALRQCGAESIRERCFPNHIVVYYVLALALFMSASYREVMRCLLEGAQKRRGKLGLIKAPNKSGISKARRRVGYRPFEILFNSFVRPIATKDTKGAWFKTWRVVTLDGSVLEVADTEENELQFGRHNSYRAKTAFPQLRFCTLIETGTRVMFGMKFGPYTKSEMALAKEVIPALEQGMLCLADRNFNGYQFWNVARQNGADLLWRSKCNTILPPQQVFQDGSYLSKLYPTATARRRDVDGIPVRVIEYQVNGTANGDPFYRLITSILDPTAASASELAMLYHQRWEIETVFGELKTYMRGSDVVLRSKSPDLVKQELYGLMLAHFAVRGLMHEAAIQAKEDPDDLSFTHSINVIKRKLQLFATFPPAPVA